MKILGLIIIALCPILAGFKLAEEVRQEQTEIESFLKLIHHIRYEISSFLTKQEQIFADFENEALEKCGFLSKLKSYTLTDEKSVLYKALSDWKGLLSIDKTSYEILLDFSSSLGRISFEEQIKKCDDCAKALNEQLEIKKKETEKKVKLYRSIGTVAGLAALIIMI